MLERRPFDPPRFPADVAKLVFDQGMSPTTARRAIAARRAAQDRAAADRRKAFR